MVPTMWVGIPDDALAPETMVPEQFARLWHKTRALQPEKRLAFSVLTEAVIDLRKYRFAKRRRNQRLYMEAYKWVASENRAWEYSFANLCDLFDLNPEAVRNELLDVTRPVEATPSAGGLEIEEAA